MKSSSSDSWIAVGRIRSAHGLHGEVTVDVLTDSPERFRQGSALYLRRSGGNPAPVRVQMSRPHGRYLILKLEAAETRTDAEQLKAGELVIPKSDVKALPPGHYYPFQLVGCEVVDSSGKSVGTVADIMQTAGGALLGVKSQRREVLIPMVEGIVTRLDLAERRIEVHLPAGLMEINA
ncbi:MAG: 16S rRNA processing protein RimM [Acidobacteria bacterium]|nr:16S rRNA processing protein RimM [Acidobacteriota bacterium]